ncbi:MAG: hypothetical protein LBD11_04180 [Candidatus Peribacteria bacterium]|jgi:hypothetical protein|nr:hypothetical protein [Candidatus Peribacteria bacterium]
MSTEEKNAVQEAMLKIGYTPSECSKCKRNNIPVVDGEVVEIDITGSGEYRKKYYTRVEGVGFSTKIACSTVELEKKKIGEVLGVFEFLRQTA